MIKNLFRGVVCTTAILVAATLTWAADDKAADPVDDLARLGHSQHGDAFDEGPRGKPWKMDGIGKSHFPISDSNPEVQAWFDQGNTLLHNFWYFEAERAFRWCLKLNPDSAMAYWGLARASRNRRWEFLLEAVRRKDSATERERMYIETWADAFEPGRGFEDQNDLLITGLEEIILKYPDDLEAKAILLNYSLGSSSRIHNELLARAILAVNPEHPGAHHYRIHNWDGPEGAKALDSCAVFGRIAYESGHANHMPGHVYSGIGMWHEGAIWMDSATRVEKAYMEKRLTLPFNAWNYAHNRNYLSYIQEQLGMANAALDGARQLLEAPLDPDKNNPDESDYNTYRQGWAALVRGLIKFERWDEILTEGSIPWRDQTSDKVWRLYAENLAKLHKGDLLEVEEGLREMKNLEEEVKDTRHADFHAIHWREIQALLMLAREETIDGLALLTEAAQMELEKRQEYNDPPFYPRILYNILGDNFMANDSPGLAVQAFEVALEEVPNDAFSLAGLARAHQALGDKQQAKDHYARLRHVWSDADPGLRWSSEVASLGIKAKPHDSSPGKQRNYKSVVLDDRGPERWQPYAAPSLDALNSESVQVALKEHLGHPVLLVFYLGEQCPHCVEQLVAIKDRFPDFEASEVAVLAVSSDTPETNAGFLKSGDIPYTLLSDVDNDSARRFGSYDEFEELELHSTFLIDSEGRIRWSRIGGGPFMDIDFLLTEIDRIDEEPWLAPRPATEGVAEAAK